MIARRCLGALLATILIFPVLAAPVSAHDPHSNGPCDLYPYTDLLYTGHTSSSPTQDRWGVKATIDPSVGFGSCSSGVDGFSFATAWIAVAPRDATPTQILQFGLIRTDCTGSQGYCHQNGIPHYFVARGGCSGATPTFVDAGVADYQPHTYQIGRSSQAGNNRWYMWLDGVQRTDLTIPPGDTATGCWLNSKQKVAEYLAERGDEGDGLGDGPMLGSGNLVYPGTWYQKAIGGAMTTNAWFAPVTPCQFSMNGGGEGFSYCQAGGATTSTNQIHMFTDYDGLGN